MANTNLRARSPKGNVGVSGFVDAGELSPFTPGVLSGFTAASAASWTLQIGGVSGTQDTAIARNAAGESELLVGTAGQSLPFIIGGAPSTPGQSRTDAIVAYRDTTVTSVVNDAIDAVDYLVVAGTAATTGTQVPPNEATIRAAITNGSLAFVAVIGYVTIAQGASGVTTGNFLLNPALSKRAPVVVATQAARDALTLFDGLEVYRTDTDAIEIYDGSAWLAFDTKWQTWTPTRTNLTLGSGTEVAKYMRQGKKVCFFYQMTYGSGSAVGSDPQITLPVTPSTSVYVADTNNGSVFGSAAAIDTNAARYPLGLQYTSSNTVKWFTLNAASTYLVYAGVSSSAPMTWATSDRLIAYGEYFTD